MPDVFSKKKRSWVMSRIHSKDTKIELVLAKALRKAGIHYKRHPKVLGTPDFLISSGSRKILVFVDGDFWHGWHYKKRKPRLSPFWRKKIEKNMSRDIRQRRLLRRMGWMVARIWEHQLTANPEECAMRVSAVLKWEV